MPRSKEASKPRTAPAKSDFRFAALLRKVQAAGWDRGQAASALMYLAAMRLKPA
ncbi:hypothetical protein [Mesorhizobium sp. M7A.F.Ca.US.010.02.1.1]|uniref:hypothetical protein n=1 Tax=unclassified Mesorhizobium TaxID=325217 RepID=UPI0003D05BA0|nr:hypothetical protein [Mesorhizobium sp. M7A.F.Ca.US.010.02.1.1]ESZ22438.1 hypothetical protein X734_29495 [Mesorhizobium sp. L2C084A000]